MILRHSPLQRFDVEIGRAAIRERRSNFSFSLPFLDDAKGTLSYHLVKATL
jgi:hypothetical protein